MQRGIKIALFDQCLAISEKRQDIGTQYQGNTHTRPTQRGSFRMTLNDLDWLSEIFNDTKRRVVSATAELLVCYSDADLARNDLSTPSTYSMSSQCQL